MQTGVGYIMQIQKAPPVFALFLLLIKARDISVKRLIALYFILIRYNTQPQKNHFNL